MDNKQQDVLATLELYKIRRDDAMREARKWFVSEFNPQSAMEIVQLLLSGAKESANYRMVTSYWDMAASFVNNGGIDEKIFLESNSEHIIVFAKMQPFVAEIREIIKEPDYLMHLETLVMKVPHIKEKLESRRRLLEKWMQ
jgi:hypothetical protein